MFARWHIAENERAKWMSHVISQNMAQNLRS